MANKNNILYCQQFDDCVLCPQLERDFCEGVKAEMKRWKKKKKKK
jgi:hypothetical protein